MRTPLNLVIVRGFILLIFFSTGFQFDGQTQEQVEASKEILPQNKGEERFNAIVSKLLSSLNGNQPADSILLEEATEWAFEKGDTLDRLSVQLLTARYYNRIQEGRQALRILKHISGSKRLNDRLLFEVTLELRKTYQQFGAFDKAMEYHRLIRWEDAPEGHEKYAPNAFLAFMYDDVGNYEKAIPLLKQAIEQMRVHNFPFHEISYVNSLGFFYENTGELDSAWHYYDKAENLLKAYFTPGQNMKVERYNFIYGLIMGNKGQVLAARGQHLNAIPLYRLDIAASLENVDVEEYRENGIISLIKLARSYEAIDQLTRGEECLAQASRYLRPKDDRELTVQLNQVKAKLMAKRGDYYGAYHLLESLVRFRDSLKNHQIMVQTNNLVLAYETLNQEEELGESLQEISYLKERSRMQKNINILFIAAIIIAVTISAYTTYILKANKKRQKAIAAKNKEIEAQKELIETSLLDKEIFLREVNHRVKNNLQIIASMLFFQSRKVDDPKAKSIMNDVQQRIQTMSTIHQKLYQEDEFERVDFNDYVKELVANIISSYQLNDIDVKLHTSIEVDRITVDRAVPLSFIIHELASNSMKHAFEGRSEGNIYVDLIENENECILTYADDGKGMDMNDLANNDRNNIGIKLIRLMSSQINAQFEFIESSPLKIEIRIPNQ